MNAAPAQASSRRPSSQTRPAAVPRLSVRAYHSDVVVAPRDEPDALETGPRVARPARGQVDDLDRAADQPRVARVALDDRRPPAIRGQRPAPRPARSVGTASAWCGRQGPGRPRAIDTSRSPAGRPRRWPRPSRRRPSRPPRRSARAVRPRSTSPSSRSIRKSRRQAPPGRMTSGSPVASAHSTARAEKSRPYSPRSAAITSRERPSADQATDSADPVSVAASDGSPSSAIVYGRACPAVSGRTGRRVGVPSGDHAGAEPSVRSRASPSGASSHMSLGIWEPVGAAAGWTLNAMVAPSGAMASSPGVRRANSRSVMSANPVSGMPETVAERRIPRAMLRDPQRRPGTGARVREDVDRPCRPDRRGRARPVASSPSSCRSSCRPSPSSPSGRPSSACGATASTRCARTWRASRRPSPTPSSPATRGPATSSSIRSAAAARPRCRPAPRAASASATTSTRSPTCSPPPRSSRRRGPRRVTRLTALRLAWAARTRWLRWHGAWPPAIASPTPARIGVRPGEPVPLEVASPSTRDASPSSCSCATRSDLDDRTTGSWPRRSPGILHGKSASYLSELMPNTFSMAPRYVRDFVARTDFASPERDVFDGLAAKLDRLYRQPLPPAEGIALLGDARDVAPRAQAALRGRGRPDRARLVVTSPPYLRVVKYGYYNWLRTWFLGLRRRGDRRRPRRRPPPRAVPRLPARRRWPGCGRRWPTTPSSSWSSATSRPTADGGSAAAIGLAERVVGAGRRARGLSAAGRRPRRRRRRPQDDQAVGRRGRAGRRRPTGSSSSARPRPAVGGRSPAPRRRRLGLAAAPLRAVGPPGRLAARAPC